MPKLLSMLMTTCGFGAKVTERAIQMQQRFGAHGSFSVMVPTNWAIGKGENFSASAPDDGPSLSGMAFRIERSPPLAEFSDARYNGVLDMGIYTQVGDERALATDGGVVREYHGVWPADRFVTHYVVACKSARETYACLSLVTSETDYIANRVFYEKMLSTLEIHS